MFISTRILVLFKKHIGGEKLSGMNNIAKLIYINDDQKQRLMEIKDEVSEANGDTSLNQLIRDAIDLLVYAYKDEIVERYSPRNIRDLVKKN